MDNLQDESNKATDIALAKLDPNFPKEVERLYSLTIYARWLVATLLWLTVAPLSLWGLRSEIALWQQHFTWVALKYGLAYNRLPAIGIALCIAMTAAVLIVQSRNILWGIPQDEQRRLEKQVMRIRQQGATHPLWKWVCNQSNNASC